MSEDNVLAAFDLLLESMRATTAQLADQVKEKLLNDELVEAKRTIAKCERVQRLMGQVRQLREAWHQVEEAAYAPIAPPEFHEETSTDGEIPPELLAANALFGAGQRKRKPRRATNVTPQHAYRIPILEALEQLGGKGRVGEVLDVVYERMKNLFTADDLGPLPTGGVRWRNAAAWERLRMVRAGLLRSDSPAGIWEI